MNYELIKILCKRRGISENKLSLAMGYTPQGYYKAISNNTMPIARFEKLCEVLEVDPALFFKKGDEASLLKDLKVSKSSQSASNHDPSNNDELIELLRFKIKALEQELNKIKGTTKQ